MSSDDKTQKPLPSAEEINAYLEASAARTRKRLPLALGNARPAAAAGPKVLKVAGAALEAASAGSAASTGATGAKGPPVAPPPERAAESGWKPFDEDQ